MPLHVQRCKRLVLAAQDAFPRLVVLLLCASVTVTAGMVRDLHLHDSAPPSSDCCLLPTRGWSSHRCPHRVHSSILADRENIYIFKDWF